MQKLVQLLARSLVTSDLLFRGGVFRWLSPSDFDKGLVIKLTNVIVLVEAMTDRSSALALLNTCANVTAQLGETRLIGLARLDKETNWAFGWHGSGSRGGLTIGCHGDVEDISNGCKRTED